MAIFETPSVEDADGKGSDRNPNLHCPPQYDIHVPTESGGFTSRLLRHEWRAIAVPMATPPTPLTIAGHSGPQMSVMILSYCINCMLTIDPNADAGNNQSDEQAPEPPSITTIHPNPDLN